jgi:Nucleoside diphosphate kinase
MMTIRAMPRDHSPDPCHSYKLAAIKLVTPSKEHLEKHYEDLSDKPFFKGLVTCGNPNRLTTCPEQNSDSWV